MSVPLRRPDWEVLPESFKGSIFLLSLVLSATMMPVEKLPAASWQTALGLGFVSAVFDNIPLTALALKQGGYDWGFLAYAVGFGGSMIWFGSSAGVALSNMYPGSEIGRALARARLACRPGLRSGFLCAAVRARVGTPCTPQGGRAFAHTTGRCCPREVAGFTMRDGPCGGLLSRRTRNTIRGLWRREDPEGRRWNSTAPRDVYPGKSPGITTTPRQPSNPLSKWRIQ